MSKNWLIVFLVILGLFVIYGVAHGEPSAPPDDNYVTDVPGLPDVLPGAGGSGIK